MIMTIIMKIFIFVMRIRSRKMRMMMMIDADDGDVVVLLVRKMWRLPHWSHRLSVSRKRECFSKELTEVTHCIAN